jgi:2-keto-3-deoxy-L-arabinonate dehydratase
MADIKRRYTGIFPVVPRPSSTPNGNIDLPGQLRCDRLHDRRRLDGLCILANFSEQFVLSDDEREMLTRRILEHVAGRVPVIVTTTHFSSRVTPSAAAPRRTRVPPWSWSCRPITARPSACRNRDL